jgi:hypothetical protein
LPNACIHWRFGISADFRTFNFTDNGTPCSYKTLWCDYTTNMKRLFFIFSLRLTALMSAQGGDNNYKYDQQDLKFLFAENKIEVFKFPFRTKKDTSLNIILEEYINGKKAQTRNFYKEIKPTLELTQTPFKDVFPLLCDSADKWTRFYLKKVKRGVEFTPIIGDVISTFAFKLSGTKMYGSKVFEVPNFLTDRQPLFAYYSNTKGDFIFCPHKIGYKELIQSFDHVVVVFADLIPTEK